MNEALILLRFQPDEESCRGRVSLLVAAFVRIDLCRQFLAILLEVLMPHVISDSFREPTIAFTLVILHHMGQLVNHHSVVIGSLFCDPLRGDVDAVIRGMSHAFHGLEF